MYFVMQHVRSSTDFNQPFILLLYKVYYDSLIYQNILASNSSSTAAVFLSFKDWLS